MFPTKIRDGVSRDNIISFRVKTCTKCGHDKPITEFSEGARYAGGHYAQCKECRNQFATKYYAADPEKYRARSRRWYAANSDTALATGRAWRTANPEKMKAAVARWARANPDNVRARCAKRRALQSAAPGRGISPAEWREILAGALGICAYCNERRRLELDHIEPLALGGEHDVDNAAAACKSCNSSKSDIPLLVWLAIKANQRALAA